MLKSIKEHFCAFAYGVYGNVEGIRQHIHADEKLSPTMTALDKGMGKETPSRLAALYTGLALPAALLIGGLSCALLHAAEVADVPNAAPSHEPEKKMKGSCKETSGNKKKDGKKNCLLKQAV